VSETVDLHDLRAYLAAEIDFPADAATVRERVGETVLDASDVDGETTVREALAPIDGEEFGGAEALFEAIQLNLPEEYVGRSGYSDRGTHIDTDQSWAE
jgi:hypothetical protein